MRFRNHVNVIISVPAIKIIKQCNIIAVYWFK